MVVKRMLGAKGRSYYSLNKDIRQEVSKCVGHSPDACPDLIFVERGKTENKGMGAVITLPEITSSTGTN